MGETMETVSRHATYLHVEHARLGGRLQIEALADLEKSYTNRSTHCTPHEPMYVSKLPSAAQLKNAMGFQRVVAYHRGGGARRW